jgi:Flp pilus assembly protein TadD
MVPKSRAEGGRNESSVMNRKERRAAAAATVTPPFIEAFNKGLALHEKGNLEEAERYYRTAMRLNPTHALLHNNLGVLYYAGGRIEEAIAMQQRAIALDPNLGIAHNNLGVSLNKLERHEEAIPSFLRAIEIEPDNSRALNNIGDSLTKSERFKESVEYIHKALAVDPLYAEAMSNMGMALWGMGDLEGAVAWLRKSLAHADLPTVHKNLGLVLLLKGDFNEAWVEYNWRLAADGVPMRAGMVPVWRGQALGEGSLFVFSEQGVGDEILYTGLLPDLLARGVKVIWDTDSRLTGLVERSFPGVRVIGRTNPPTLGSPSPDVAAQLPAGSLGQIFRRGRDQFPQDRRGYLVADKNRSQALRASLGLAPGEKLVGISWVSKNIAFGRHKSTTLAEWAPIMKTPGVRFVDLQYGDTSEERAALHAQHGLTLTHVEGLDLRDDLEGMAALTAACDLVITVSNTTAHVAGALGVPTWVLVPLGGGKLWYWGTQGDSTPWYPAITIIRQVNREEWPSTLRIAEERLRALLAV